MVTVTVIGFGTEPVTDTGYPPLAPLVSEGSNMMMLPPKKKKKNKENSLKKGSRKSKKGDVSKPSSSQNRKLKKLEEEKEKAILLARSIETLEKYKIQEDAFSLMWSSRNLGQVETVREKRRRELQFAKTGLVLQHCDRPLKRSAITNSPGDIRPIPLEVQSNQEYNGEFSIQAVKREVKVVDTKSVPQELSSDEAFGDGAAAIGALDTPMLVKEVDNVHFKASELKDSYTSLPINDSRSMVKSTDVVSCRSSVVACPSVKGPSAPTVVHVSRPKEVEEKRMDLPIVMMEQEIMEAVHENISVIICGETGCGKTTQVPQFLFEAGFGSKHCIGRSGIIGVTQPRRVAVLATAKRVAYELGLRLGKEIGFQVRHDRRIGDSCSIKFMTDGILLRELQNDFLLKQYSVIILDEAHERSLNTDILVGMLSRIIVERLKIHEQQKAYELSTGKMISPDKKVHPLRLILMSATLPVEDFMSDGRIFPNPPPVIEVPTRQYPVTVHFSKRTNEVDYIGKAYKKILSIHKRLPSGGILVFVTGQREVEYLCSKLRQASSKLMERKSKVNNEVPVVTEENLYKELNMKDIDEAFEIKGQSGDQQTERFSSYDDDEYNFSEGESLTSFESEEDSDLEETGDDGGSANQNPVSPGNNLVDVLGEEGNLASLKFAFEALAGKSNFKTNSDRSQDEAFDTAGSKLLNPCSPEMRKDTKDGCAGPMRVLPLYAMLPASAQLHVFEGIKEGERLVVVATNVAETSLTIPGIKYVVDTGREKVKNFNSSNGMENYEVQWISKASAAQRAGRAGRTAPGHCYRLYSSAVFSRFHEYSAAEILKIPVDGVILLMKSMGIKEIAKFPFPTPPENTALVEADLCLKALEALDNEGRLTPLGKAMSHYPMSPRHSRMLLTVIQTLNKGKGSARRNLVLGYALAVAAALSLLNPFEMQGRDSGAIDGEDVIDTDEKLKKKKQKEIVKASLVKFSNPTSDALTVAYALQCFELSENKSDFCRKYALSLKIMEEMSKLRKQLLHLVFRQTISDTSQEYFWSFADMEGVERAWMVCSNRHPLLLDEEEILGQAICAGWADRVARRVRASSELPEKDRKVKAARYHAHRVKETVFLHRWSSVSKTAPEFLVYSELIHTTRPFIHGATRVKPGWLAKYSANLCSFSAPLMDPKPYYEPQSDQIYNWVSTTYGDHLWQLPLHSLPAKDDKLRTAIFGFSLLDGLVLPCLRSVREFMVASPASILKPEVSGHKQLGQLIYELRKRNIHNCGALRSVWNENQGALYSELLAWFQKGFHLQFHNLWEEMHREVCLDYEARFAERVKKQKRKKVG